MFYKIELVFFWKANAIYRIPWLVLRILRACVSRQLLIHNHKIIKLLPRREENMKCVIRERVAQRLFPRFNKSKTLKIYHVLENLNYGILRIYEEFWEKVHERELVGCKNLECKRYHTLPD